MGKSDTPGVVAPPPLILAGALGLGALLGRIWPAPLLGEAGADPRRAAGLALVLGAFAIAAAAAARFRHGGTNVQTYRPTTALVTGGPYRWSRNPIYTAMIGLVLGTGLLADDAWIAAMAAPFALVLRYGVIAREERYLEAKFGEAYRAYRSSARRWV